MQIIVHRGTHQIGGVATEIRTSAARIIIDMGDELNAQHNTLPAPLSIPGVTDGRGHCDGVFCTHYHIDHIGQLKNIRSSIPIYMGPLAKEVLLETLPKAEAALMQQIHRSRLLTAGKRVQVGDIVITPFSIDHSACDSYMFLIEAEGKRLLHTGDVRCHGFRGTAVGKILKKYIGKVDVLILEGTALSRPAYSPMTERQLQQKVKHLLGHYKYVFAFCASTNLERIAAMSKAVPSGRYFICDRYQYKLLDLLEQHWGGYSTLYRAIKKTVYSTKLLPQLRQKRFFDDGAGQSKIPCYHP